jgi:uncharacterized protein (DUF1697 family)
MARYIAFLRSINVGGHNVKMDALCRLFEAMKFSAVETIVASGNVIFESKSSNVKAMERRIESRLLESLGYKVAAFVRSAKGLAEIAKYKPFGAQEDGAGLYIAFVAEPLSKEAEKQLLSCKTESDDFHVRGREIYWLCHTRFSESPFSGPRLEKILGTQATVRNSTTVRKIAAKYG